MPPFGDGYCALAFSSSGQLLLAINLATFVLEVYDLGTFSLVGHFAQADCLAIHPNSDMLVAAFTDFTADLTVVSVSGGCRIVKKTPDDLLIVSIATLVFSPCGDRLVVVHESPPGSDMTVPGACLTVLDYPSMKEAFEFRIELPLQLPSWVFPRQIPPIERVGLTRDESRIIVPGADGFITELDSVTGQKLAQWHAHDDVISSVDLRRHDDLLITGGCDGKIAMWKE